MEVTNQEETRFYEFGPFVLDATKFVLMRDGDVVPLNLKAFEILLVLIRHRGKGLEKDELIKQVWPDTIVEENNLARNISALRKALDEHPNQHQYILTIPGKGYRFIADVKESGLVSLELAKSAAKNTNGHTNDVQEPSSGELILPPDPGPQPTTITSKSSKALHSTAGIIAMVITAIFLSGLIVYFFSRPSHTDADAPHTHQNLWQLTFDSGLESEPSWSPDGRLIAYSSNRGGNFDIWVQPVGEGNPVRVTKSPAHDWQPDWAPDGNRLVFRSERDGGGLYVVPVLGGNEHKISSFGYRPRWSPDGTQVLFYSSMLRTNTIEIPRIYVVGLDGKPPVDVLTGFLSEFEFLRVAWHPDGKRISVWGNHRQHGWSLWTIPISGAGPIRSELPARTKEQFKGADVSFSDFVWSSSGKEIYFEGESKGVRNLWKVGVDPSSLKWTSGPERITTGTGLETDLAISPDGKKLAFTERTEHTRLWSLPFDSGSGRTKGNGEPVTAAGIDARCPDLSFDGQKLAFIAQRAGKWDIWEKSLRDGKETMLASDDLLRTRVRWSRDGLRLAYSRARFLDAEHSKPERETVLLSVNNHEEQLLSTPSSEGETIWDWSSDGKWLLGGSKRQTPGDRAVCLFPVASAPHAEKDMRVVTTRPGQNLYQARFSPDDRWISFCAAGHNEAGISTIYVVPSSGGEWINITEGKFFDDKPRWSPDGRTIYFISNRTGFFNVWGIKFDPASGRAVGESFRVTSLESPGQMILSDMRMMDMALAADRLVLPIMEVSGAIWILENVEH